VFSVRGFARSRNAEMTEYTMVTEWLKQVMNQWILVVANGRIGTPVPSVGFRVLREGLCQKPK
jgi:hypothetical protein